MDFRIFNTSKQTFCDCCGKTNLPLTIECKVRDANDRYLCTVRYGTTCAKIATGMVREDGLRIADKNIVRVATEYASTRSDWDKSVVVGPRRPLA